MKFLLVSALLAITAKQCKDAAADYASLPNARKVLKTVEADAKSLDSARMVWAKEFAEEFSAEYKKYSPSIAVLDSFRMLSKTLEIKVIGGNWCSDTRREIPRLAKVLDLAGFNADRFQYFPVDKDKKPYSNNFASTYSFKWVPTIVVYQSGKECGKIVETAEGSTEAHLLKIIRACR